MPKPRAPGVYCSRGRWYARVRVGDSRPSVALPASTTREQAVARAAFLFEIVEALRDAGQLSLLDLHDNDGATILDRAGAANGDAALDEIRKLVAGIVA